MAANERNRKRRLKKKVTIVWMRKDVLFLSLSTCISVDDVCWAETNLVWSIWRCFSRFSIMVHAWSNIDSSTLLIRLEIHGSIFSSLRHWNFFPRRMTHRNGCGKSSKISAGSPAKSVCSFKWPCREGIGIDCSSSVTRSLKDYSDIDQ